jgi:thaumarchaeosortase
VCFSLKNREAPKHSQSALAYLFKLLLLVSVVVPMVLLFLLNPAEPYNVSVQESFELMWKGRTFMVFFIWLILLEFILGWEKFQINLQNKTRLAAYALTLFLPTIYVFAEYYMGLNSAIVGFSQNSGVLWADSMPLAIEYLVFSMFFLLTAYFGFGKKGLTGFALPALFVALVGFLYTIDNVFPYGQFTPFAILVPTTASLAGALLGWMGNTVVPGTDVITGMPTLMVSGPAGSATFAIAWPCAGIESLLIFTAVALLFLKQMSVSWKAKLGFFAVGAAVTYFINIVRISTIFTLGMQYGTNSVEVSDFHFYYGPLYAMTWIVTYPIILLVTVSVWHHFKRSQPKPLNPA